MYRNIGIILLAICASIAHNTICTDTVDNSNNTSAFYISACAPIIEAGIHEICVQLDTCEYKHREPTNTSCDCNRLESSINNTTLACTVGTTLASNYLIHHAIASSEQPIQHAVMQHLTAFFWSWLVKAGAILIWQDINFPDEDMLTDKEYDEATDRYQDKAQKRAWIFIYTTLSQCTGTVLGAIV